MWSSSMSLRRCSDVKLVHVSRITNTDDQGTGQKQGRWRPSHQGGLFSLRLLFISLASALFLIAPATRADTAAPRSVDVYAANATVARVEYVRTPEDLQRAVRDGVRHIVVQEHLDMSAVPRFADLTGQETIMDSARLAVWPNELGEHTTTIRGDCTDDLPGTLPDDAPPHRPGQCMITLREDFLEANISSSSHVWVSGLYIFSQQFVDKNHTTVLKSAHSNLYLTDLVLIGGGHKSRAVDVKEGQTVFIADSHFHHFQKDKDGVMRISAGGRATVVNSTFTNNIVSTGLATKVPAGPVAGLKTWTSKYNYTKGSAAWFTDCEYKGSQSVNRNVSTMAVPGEVAVEDSESAVYTNTALPTVWHLNNSEEIRALTVAPASQPGSEDVFADVADRLGPFLRPDNDRFLAIVEEQARLTGMPEAMISQVPAGTDLELVEPPPLPVADDGDGGANTGAIAGSIVSVLVLMVLTCVAAFCVIRRRRAKAEEAAAAAAAAEAERAKAEAAKESLKVQLSYGSMSSSRTGSDIPSALATNTHWVTEMDDTFMVTMIDIDGPPPDPTAPITSRLDFLHAQLSSIGCQTVVLERHDSPAPLAGQGIVAFGKGVHDDLGYALKFFVDRPSFLSERDMYRSKTLGSLLPQVHAEYDPEETPGLLLDRSGRPLPPCIVMERGEGLPDWSKRAKPDVFQSVAVLAHVATRLRNMHESGYAHRDIKPENLMFLPRENRWTVIDFGCAAVVGEVAPLSYTLVYMAPEVAAAVAAGEKTIVASAAMDAWALGVVAFELLTGQSAFNLVTEGRDSVLDKLLGKGELAWEGDLAEKNPLARRRLGLFREPILSLLHRDPSERATLAAFCRTTNTVFSSPTTIQMQ